MTLKRQGERPFKDSLTLEDYGIRDGSSLDDEIGTGDSREGFAQHLHVGL